MAYHKGNAFLERVGILTAYRNPEPRCEPGKMPVHSLTLHPPKPNYMWQGYLQGAEPPDRGPTLPWPHPNQE